MGLILALILASAALWIVWLSVRGSRAAIRSAEEFQQQLRDVDLEAMQNLMSPSEDAFLRRALSEADYREVERARIRAMLDYISAISWNAALFMRAVGTLRRNPDPQVAASAASISKQALDLRMLSLLAQVALYLRLLIPTARISPLGIAGAYAEVRGQLARAWSLEQSVRAA